MKKFFMKKIYKMLINRIYNPFISNNVKPYEFMPVEGEKYLIIAPHPDDESIGCGGIMSLYREYFDVLCLTHGAQNDVRREELYNAMNLAGIKNVNMLELPDKHVISGQETFNGVDISNYDMIFIPFIFDQHKDHKAVSLLLAEKLKKSGFKNNLKIAFYEVWSAMNMPNCYVDISSVIDQKKAIINCHKSQIATKNYADKIIGLNAYRGLLKSLDAAECFSVVDVSDFYKIISKIVWDIE